MSKSWLLTNSKGTTDMVRGEMDISFRDGSVVEITAPSVVLDQRVRKCAMELQGSNPFDPDWGSQFPKLLGGKVIDETVQRQLAYQSLVMLNNLMVIQAQTLRRLDLEPAEIIDGIAKLAILVQATVLGVRATIITQAKKASDVLIPEVLRAVA